MHAERILGQLATCSPAESEVQSSITHFPNGFHFAIQINSAEFQFSSEYFLEKDQAVVQNRAWMAVGMDEIAEDIFDQLGFGNTQFLVNNHSCNSLNPVGLAKGVSSPPSPVGERILLVENPYLLKKV